jgi:aspartyl-tRNA(Asn)/glutamyl-tRNA(Gln) amidotransferase subunit C
MKITRAEVGHVARLARLELTEEETETFTGQMDAILAYVEKLNELDTAGIVPTTLTVRDPSLDDVFLALTGHHAEEAA